MRKLTKEGIQSKRIHVNTTLSLGDYNYVTSNALVFSKLLENAINIHRIAHEEGINENYHSYLKQRAMIIKERLDKALAVLEKNNLISEFMKLEEENVDR